MLKDLGDDGKFDKEVDGHICRQKRGGQYYYRESGKKPVYTIDACCSEEAFKKHLEGKSRKITVAERKELLDE